MSRALLIIDIQRDYFPGGAYPLVEPEAAADAARRVLDRFREGGEPVVHLKHVWDAPDAAFMKPGTDGIEIHDTVAPGRRRVGHREGRSRTASSARRWSSSCATPASTSSSSRG